MEVWKDWYQTKEDWLHWHRAGLDILLGSCLQKDEYTVEDVETENIVSTMEETLKNNA